jgi:hypothetical protein
MIVEDHNETLRSFISEAFEDEDFPTVEVYGNAVLRGGDLMKEMGVAIQDYLALMPDDIKDAVERQIARRQFDDGKADSLL